jgi:diaminopimelate decarboxylase
MSKPVKQYDLLKKLNLMPVPPTPLLPLDDLRAFVQHHFCRRDLYLQIIENHPAPIYLQESAILRSRAAQIRKAFEDFLPAVAFYYAVKSNNHPDIARVMLAAGFGLDVSSGLELEMALSTGARDVVFSGPGKTVAELQLAVAHADRVIVLMDSPGELHRLEGIAAKADRSVRCGVRLTVNPNGLWRKFGIVPQALSSFWDEVGRCRHVQLLGLQFHSSWNLSPEPQIEFIRTLGNMLAEMPASFVSQMEFIDIGGGYWPAQGEWLQPAGTPEGKLLEALGQQTEPVEVHHRLPATGIEEFAERLSAAIHKHLFSVVPCRICLEPGRWICNDAVQLLFSVVDKKAPDLVITDAGTNTIGWERFESDYFPILNLTRPAMNEKPCHVLGSLCTPHDVWGYAFWGENIEPGDILLIPNQGAYTYSLRQNFIKPLPEVVTI